MLSLEYSVTKAYVCLNFEVVIEETKVSDLIRG